MARSRKKRYQARVCDGSACKDIGKATADVNKAIRRMQREVAKTAHRKFRRLKADQEFQAVHGEVWEKAGRETVGEAPVFVGAEAYGAPRPRRSRAPKRASCPTE